MLAVSRKLKRPAFDSACPTECMEQEDWDTAAAETFITYPPKCDPNRSIREGAAVPSLVEEKTANLAGANQFIHAELLLTKEKIRKTPSTPSHVPFFSENLYTLTPALRGLTVYCYRDYKHLQKRVLKNIRLRGRKMAPFRVFEGKLAIVTGASRSMIDQSHTSLQSPTPAGICISLP